MGFFLSFLVSLAFMVVGELLRPKQAPADAEAASLDNFDFPTATEARNWPWMAGECLIEGGNVTWYGDLSSDAIKKKVKTGLWSSKRVTIGHRYFLGIEMFLTIGEIEDIREVRFGGETTNLVTKTVTANEIVFNFNAPNMFGGNEKDGGVTGIMRVFKGTQTQGPCAYLANAIGRARSAYRGLCYVAIEGMYIGTRENLRPLSFVVARYPNTLAVTSNKHKIGTDANPVCMIYEMLTDTKWGAGIPSTEIDLVNFRAIADQLHAEGTGLSMLINSNRSVRDAVTEILRHIDGAMYTDTQTGLLSIAIARDDYDVNTLEEFGPESISSFSYSRGSWASTKNNLVVTYIDRLQDFSPRSFPIRESGNLQARGGEIASEEVSFLGFTNSTVAMRRGLVMLKTMSYPLMTTKIIMNGKGWKLKPGGVFKLSWPAENIESVVMRVVRINKGDIVRNRIELDCIEDVFAISSTVYTPPPQSGWTNPAGQPQPLAAQAGFEAPYHMLGLEGRYAAVMGSRFSGIDEGYERWHDPAGGSTYTFVASTGEFTPTGILTAEYPATTAAVHTAGFSVSSARDFSQLLNASDAEFYAGDSLLLIKSTAGEEWMAWKSVTNNGDGTYTIGTVMRGIFDTVPLTHPAGSRVWFVSYGVDLLIDTPYTANGTVTGKLLPFNPLGILPITSASQLAIPLAQRSWKPYPVARIRVDGSDNDDTIAGSATLTWSIRHRLLQHQAGVVVAQDAANYTPTPEGVYEVKVYIDGAVRRTVSISAAPFDTFDYTTAMRLADYADVTKRVTFGVRAINGVYSSIERLSHEFYMIDVLTPINITTTTLPTAETSQPYSVQLAVTGGASPYTWTKTAGVWPVGISMSSGGLISGTPTSLTEVQTVTVQVEGPTGFIDTQVLTLTVSSDCADYVVPASTGVTFNLIEVEAVLAAIGNEVHICNEIIDSPFDGDYASVVTLLHFNGSDGSTAFVDEKGHAWTAVGNAQIDTARSKFGGAALLLDGAGDSSACSHADLNLNSTNYTVEAWVYLDVASISVSRGIYSTYTAAGNGRMSLYIDSDGSLNFSEVDASGTNASLIQNAASGFTPSVWHHVAAVKQGTSQRLYLDGVLVASGTSAIRTSFTDQGRIGTFDGTTWPWIGSIDEVRVTKAARYNENFSPRTLEFPD